MATNLVDVDRDKAALIPRRIACCQILDDGIRSKKRMLDHRTLETVSKRCTLDSVDRHNMAL